MFMAYTSDSQKKHSGGCRVDHLKYYPSKDCPYYLNTVPVCACVMCISNNMDTYWFSKLQPKIFGCF